MAELKTKPNNASVSAFINAVEHEQRRKDAKHILKMMKEITGEKPKMWGSSIVGFGTYHYKSDRSRQEGEWPMTGFSPRKGAMSIYIMHGLKNHPKLLKKLGKYKNGVSCLYVKKLEDIDLTVLRELIKRDYEYMKKKYSGSKQQSRRARNPMPRDILARLKKEGVMSDYTARPAYQRNDYLGWIGRAKQEDIREKRISQMIQELKNGGVYMKMGHNPSRKT